MSAISYCILLAVLTVPAYSQEPSAVPNVAGGEPAAVEQDPAPPAQADRSVIEVKPGGQVIKNKDLWEGTGYFHPFGRMPKYVLSDQFKIWTSPFHTAKSDAKWWAIFGGATAALIATDKWTVKQLPNTEGQVRLGTYTSRIGAAYTLIPLSAGFYFLGTAAKSERFRETGLLAFETLIDTTIVNTILKAATHRARPLQGNGEGHFWDSSGSVLNAGFPSGHAINTWALASVFAHQYRRHIWVPIVAYTLAGTVVGARVSARKHFPGDVVAGAAMGWFIGDFVYGRRHNPAIAGDRTLGRKILAHIRFGFELQ
jgi:membrane-associated phospholipid phosphatase